MSIAGDIASVVTALAAAIAVTGGYLQFVVRRSLLPAVEFDLEFTTVYSGSTQIIGELACVIRNVGSSMLIVTNVKCRGRYRLAEDREGLYGGDLVEPAFEHSLDANAPWLILVGPRTFVQPAVTQRYCKPVAMPATAQVLKLVGSFDYRISVGRVTNALLSIFWRPDRDLDWRRGISNHTAVRTFLVTKATQSS
jgi:hypothetical protein